jgi:hypothetical protein
VLLALDDRAASIPQHTAQLRLVLLYGFERAFLHDGVAFAGGFGLEGFDGAAGVVDDLRRRALRVQLARGDRLQELGKYDAGGERQSGELRVLALDLLDFLFDIRGVGHDVKLRWRFLPVAS